MSLTEATVGAECAPTEPILRTHKLRRSFGKLRIIEDLDLEVKRGEIYAFLGRNGAGKTTTIRMIMGILKPNGGRLEFFGQEVRRPTVPLKRRIGYVSQEEHFYPWMTCELIGRFVGGFYPTWEVAEYNRLLEVMDLPPERKVSQLSCGMKTKLGLALALAHRPELLILDEPTSGLDPVARREFLEMVHHQARKYGRTTFFSTHLIDEVENVAARVGIIEGGRLCYQGGVAELRAAVRRWVLDGDVADEAMAPLPDGLRELSRKSVDGTLEITLEGEPGLWSRWRPEAGRLEEPSLEDIFIAYVGKSAVTL